ncbi:hypothetical protein LEMLEM_LOCUS12287 [Lemmus lemmus]
MVSLHSDRHPKIEDIHHDGLHPLGATSQNQLFFTSYFYQGILSATGKVTKQTKTP